MAVGNEHASVAASKLDDVCDTSTELPMGSSYRVPFTNVTDEIVRPSNDNFTATPKQEPILIRVEDIVPEVSSHNAAQARRMDDPNIQRELALLEHLVVAGKDADVPYTPYLTKCQRKKIAKKGYQTRSMGPLQTLPQRSFFIGIFEVLGIQILEFPLVNFIVLTNLYCYLLLSLWCRFLSYLVGFGSVLI